jgi:hypothetical protein
MNMTPAEARAIAREACIYGLPLVDNMGVQYSYFTDKIDPDYEAHRGIYPSLASSACRRIDN